jgi:L-lactate dehydrogenase complex protein LldF
MRTLAVEGTSEWDELRERAREIKRTTIENLDYYLLMLEESLTREGCRVHWAGDAEEAREIILGIARDNGVKRVVKSKSMATEEIELNQAFAEAGIKAVETDLGEYIIQLAGEHPSHIIAPAIHKTMDGVARLFAEKLGVPVYGNPEELAQVARMRLRGEFIEADMGVSGVNFAVAETGTIVIVENEGNARFTTTLPRIHVALMGMEKVIPRLEDLPLFLNLLIKSATGQKLTSYVSLITGTRREGEIDGPTEVHLVILDNGRSRILADPEARESLFCLRCGACLNVCPVYRQVGGHSYGGVYSGPIGAIITPQLMGLERAGELPFASTLCGACREVCPVRIDIPRVLINLRTSAVSRGANTSCRWKRFAEWLGVKMWRLIMENRTLFSMAVRVAYLLQKPLLPSHKDPTVIKSLPPPLSNWTAGRDFPAVAKESFRKRWGRFK